MESPGPLCRVGRGIRPLAVVAALALVFAATMTGTASAQDVEGQRAKVQRLAAEMERLEARSSALDEQYLQTKLQMDKVAREVEQNQAAVADARTRMDEAKAQAGSYIVSAYMSAGSDVAGLGVGDPNKAVNERVLMETLHGDRQQVADDLRAAQLDLDDRNSELESSSKALADQQAKQDAVRAELESSVSEQQRLLDGANAELRSAIAAEQERKAAEAAKAAAEAQAREQAAAAARAQRSAQTASAAAAPRAAAAPARTGSTTSGARKPASPAPAPALPAAPVSGGAAAAIAAAQSVMGTPYKWAGASPATGFDCSGLTQWAWARGGKSLPHSSSAQYAATQRISLDQLQPGDLVFFNNPISHVGLYIGGGQMIHSPHTGDVVKVSPITRMGKLVRAGRVA